jgi:hypothetical protein
MVKRIVNSPATNDAAKAEQTKSPQRYQVRLHGQWTEVQYGVRVMEEFLHYELEDGTTGTARPLDWRLNRTVVETTRRRKKRLGS